MKKVSILIPVYNESGNIAPMLEALDKALSGGYLYEIMFIDDGSRMIILRYCRE
jgi:dolichol-phosphate mannosyltransferase